MSINVPVKVRIEMTKKFEWAYKKSIEMSIKHITKSIKNEMPSDSGKTKAALDYSIDFNQGEAIIGWQKGSHAQLVGNVLQFGSGAEGSKYVTSRFGEQRPQYTVPIMPTHGKAMTYMGKDGQRKFMTSFKGHAPKEVLTKGMINSMKFLPIIISNEMNK